MAKSSWLLSCTALIHLTTMAHGQQIPSQLINPGFIGGVDGPTNPGFASIDPAQFESMMQSCDVVDGEVRNRDNPGCDQFAIFLQVAQAQGIALPQRATRTAAAGYESPESLLEEYTEDSDDDGE